MSKATWWLLAGAVVVWYFYDQNQKAGFVGPQVPAGFNPQPGGTMAPCAPGWYQGTDLTGNLTCLPVASTS